MGERLYPSTAPDGREIIRQELRKLKLGYESLFDDLSTIQRKLDLSMVQWDSFDESYDQVCGQNMKHEEDWVHLCLLIHTLEFKRAKLAVLKLWHHCQSQSLPDPANYDTILRTSQTWHYLWDNWDMTIFLHLDNHGTVIGISQLWKYHRGQSAMILSSGSQP